MTLKPGESEIINVDVRYVSGFYYTFQIGVLFKVGNKSHIKWIDEKLTIGIPDVAENVVITDGITFYADAKTTDTVNLDGGVIPDNAQEIIQKAKTIVRNSPFAIPTK